MSVGSTPAGRGRFWGVVAIILVLNVFAWILYTRVFALRSDVLRVESATPSDNSIVDTKTPLTWKFNFDMSPNAPQTAMGTIRPAIDGQWKWIDTRTLTFVPSAPLPKATEISVTLQPENLRSVHGFGLPRSFNTHFRTTPFQFVSAKQIGFAESNRVILALEFDDAVAPEAVMKNLMLSCLNQEIKASLYGSPEGKIVRVITDPIPTELRDEKLKLHLQPGLAGASGPLAMDAPVDCTVALTRTLMATGATAQSRGDEASRLSIGFNGPIDAAVLRAQLKIEPETKYMIENRYDGVQLIGDFKPASRYTLTLAAPPAGADPTQYPKAGMLSVFVPDKEATAWFDHDSGYLGSKGNRTILAHAVNVPSATLDVYRVYDNNLVAWRTSTSGRYERDLDQFAKPIATKTIKLSTQRNTPQDIRIAMDDLVPDGARDGVYQIQMTTEAGEVRRYYRNQPSAVVTLCDIGLVAKKTRTGACVWAVSLADAKPLANVRVRLFSSKNQPLGEATTDADGLARISHGKLPDDEVPAVVLADRINGSVTTHLTWLDLRSSSIEFTESDIAGSEYLRSGHEAFLYTDRGVYRPGETVYLRGIVRGPNQSTPSPFPVKWQILRPDLRNWKSQVAKLNDDGSCEWALQLPADLPTGRWSASLALPGEKSDAFGKVSFQVEEFLPDRMKVAIDLPQIKDGRIQLQQADITAQIQAQVQADYLFGQPAAGLHTDYSVRLDAARFTHPKWSNWTFGDDAGVIDSLGFSKFSGRIINLPEQATDVNGRANASFEFASFFRPDPNVVVSLRPDAGKYSSGPILPGPYKLSIAAAISENGGRAITATQTAFVDQLDYYIALPKAEALFTPGQPSPIKVALVCPDGSTAVKDVALDAQVYREIWTNNLIQKDGRYRYESTRTLEPVGAKQPISISQGQGEIDAIFPDGGSYVVAVKQPETNSITTLRVMAGSGAWADSISRENPEKLEISIVPISLRDTLTTFASPIVETKLGKVLNQLSNYLPAESTLRSGGGALAIIRSPFAGQLLLSVETDDVVRTQVVAMQKSSIVVPIALDDSMRPNAYVSATVVRNIDANATWRVHRAVGVAKVLLDNSDRRLNVEFDAPEELRPMQSLSSRIRVTDQSGKPVANASLSVAAVDEGICALTRFKTPDPFSFFFGKRGLGVDTADLYSQLMPEVAKPDKNSAVGGDGDDGYDARNQTPVSAKRVKPVSLVSAFLKTDKNGIARFDASIPAFTGQLRLMASVHEKNQFGSGQSGVIVRSPLMVQTSWPRFAAPGDVFNVSFTIFNHSSSAGAAQLRLQCDDGSPLEFVTSKSSALEVGPIFVKANGQTTGFVAVRALAAAGVAKIRLTATLNEENYEESLELPVRPASPAITRGGFESLSPGQPLSLKLPVDFMPGTIDCSVRVSNFPSLRLPQGLDYLDRYPYGCAEQTTSTLFPMVYLSDIGDRIGAGVFAKDRIEDKINTGITRLIGMQTRDGGIAMWPGGRDSWPWVSVYAAHFVVNAERAGWKVPQDFRDRLIAYVREQLHRSDDNPSVVETQAYACYVLAVMGDPQTPVMSRLGELLSQMKDGSTQARFHLASAWLASGRRDIAIKLLPAELPKPRGTRQNTGNIGSPVRDRAILLDTLLNVDPTRPEIPSIAQELADAAQKDEWRSTQDCAFAVMALGKYLRTIKPSAEFESAELLSGDVALANGKSIDWSGKSGATNLKLSISGQTDARGYVAWLASGVPMTTPAAEDHGIKIRRRLLDRNGKQIKGSVRSGELVQIELSLESSSAIENLVLVDLLPAGLEIENPRLEGAASKASFADRKNQTPTFVPDRTDIRDDRLILFGDLTREGRCVYSYLARAVTVGEYTLPPARVECMYDLGINSTDAAGKLVVEPLGGSTMVDTGRE